MPVPTALAERRASLPARAAFAIALAAGLASCEFGAGVAPAVQPRIEVNAVLNPSVAEQVLLVERTLTRGRPCDPANAEPPPPGSSFRADDCSADPADPIVAAGGDPISGATVVVYGPAGDSAVAVEDLARRGDGRGAGVYRILNAAVDGTLRLGAQASLAVVAGQRYRLRVSTPIGTASGATTVPSATGFVAPPRVTYNVERGDVLRRAPTTAAGAAGYLVVLDAANGRARRVYDGPVSLTAFSGTLIAANERDPTGESRVAVSLYPGLRSDGTVSAIDSNYRRALRSGEGEDPFSSENPGSSIDGGVGLFGSIVPLAALRLDVVSFFDEPIEGRYFIVDGPAAAPREFRIYSYRGALSGNYLPSNPEVSALFGTRGVDPPIRLDFFSDRFQFVRAGTLDGRIVSGELRGTYTPATTTTGSPVSYRRTP